MILNDGYRKIKYIENIAKGKDYMWCDADENLLDMK